MRSLLVAPLVVFGALLLQGCESDGDELEGPRGYGDPRSTAPGAAASDDDRSAPPPVATPVNPDFGARALERGRSWIAAKVPYCGGPNGGKDVICGGTCSRSGSAANDAWDDYRSDCSGFVSFAWGLAAPGNVTSGFAPYDDAVSTEIDASELAPGDALNNSEHVMLFGGWADEEKKTAILLQETRCGTTASEKQIGLKLNGGSKVAIQDTTGRVFHAVRATEKVRSQAAE